MAPDEVAIKSRAITNGDALDSAITGYRDGTNRIYGLAGNDYLYGGALADTLDGGVGNDSNFFDRSFGIDTIADYETAANSDSIGIGGSIASSQLWFTKTNSDLQIRVIGTGDQITVKNWYSSTAYQAEQIKASDNKVLVSNKVDSLVQAMAAFTPPPLGQTTLPANYQSSVNASLAASWQ